MSDDRQMTPLGRRRALNQAMLWAIRVRVRANMHSWRLRAQEMRRLGWRFTTNG